MDLARGIDPETGKGVAIGIAEGKIASITPDQDAPRRYLSAGLIDLQVNGFQGHDLNSPDISADTVVALCNELAKVGVTSWLPTLITASEESLIHALRTIVGAKSKHRLVAEMVCGIHVEGPSISPADGPRGAHPLADVRPPSVTEFERWRDASQQAIRMITLAPEHPGSANYIRHVVRQNVTVAIGHTAATPEQISEAVTAGASLSTHLGNGIAAELPRHPNLIWAQLAEDRLEASFIADSWHLPADTFKAMLRAKGLDRSVLVSDTVALAGMAPGIYQQAIGGEVEVSAEGRISVAGTPYLAGASLPLSANVALAATMAELALHNALRLATANPGRYVGNRGRLEVGARADLIAFEWAQGARQLSVMETWVAGEKVFAV